MKGQSTSISRHSNLICFKSSSYTNGLSAHSKGHLTYNLFKKFFAILLNGCSLNSSLQTGQFLQVINAFFEQVLQKAY